MVGPTRGGTWRYRLPGGRGERAGFATREDAVAALDDALAGPAGAAGALWKLLARGERMARALGLTLEQAIEAARTNTLIEWSRKRRAERRTKEE